MRTILIQHSSSADVFGNIEKLGKLASKIKGQADAIVFPELAPVLGSYAHVAELAAEAEKVSGDFYGKLASALGCYVIGTMPIPEANGRYKNAIRVFDNKGTITAEYAKMHLFDVGKTSDSPDVPYSRESEWVDPGDRAVVADVAGARCGFGICYDLRFPAMFWRMRGSGAEIIFLPSAFSGKTGEKHWFALLRARAIETQSYIVAPNQCGEIGGLFPVYGHSAVIGPDGEVLLDAGASEGVFDLELDLERVRRARMEMPNFDNRHGSDNNWG